MTQANSTPQESLAQIREIVEEYWQKIGLQPKMKISYDEESGYYQIQLDTDSPGLLIGYRGETLSAIQLTISLLLKHKIGHWIKVIVNVGDYRQKREETLTELAHNVAKRVAFSQEVYRFKNLSAPERRIVHLALKDHPQVMTYSEGEGRHRDLIVAPK